MSWKIGRPVELFGGEVATKSLRILEMFIREQGRLIRVCVGGAKL